jgi:hypothetical protein
MVYPALLPLMRTPRLPVVDWTDAPADLNGLVRFAKRENLVSARVLSHFKRSLPHSKYLETLYKHATLKKEQIMIYEAHAVSSTTLQCHHTETRHVDLLRYRVGIQNLVFPIHCLCALCHDYSVLSFYSVYIFTAHNTLPWLNSSVLFTLKARTVAPFWKISGKGHILLRKFTNSKGCVMLLP